MKCAGVNWPVREGHALEQFGERRVYWEMRRARLPEVISLTSLFINRVEVVAFLRRMLDVRGWNHKMTAVDDLRLSSVWFLMSEVCVLGVGVVVVLLRSHVRIDSSVWAGRHYTSTSSPLFVQQLFSRSVWLIRDISYYCLPGSCKVLRKRITRFQLIFAEQSFTL